MKPRRNFNLYTDADPISHTSLKSYIKLRVMRYVAESGIFCSCTIVPGVNEGRLGNQM